MEKSTGCCLTANPDGKSKFIDFLEFVYTFSRAWHQCPYTFFPGPGPNVARLAELLEQVAIIGVLVAISIPIFTNQLKKAKLATNQANARAAYAAVETYVLLNEDLSADNTYKYDTANNATVTDEDAPATVDFSAGTDKTDISSWTISSPEKAGDNTYKVWYVTVNKDGKVTGFKATK